MGEWHAIRGASVRRAWLIWALGALSFGYAFFQRVQPSVMVSDLMRDFDVGGAVLGNLAAIYLYAYAGLQVPIGVMLDQFGPRRMLTAAAAVAGTGSLLFATADTLALAYAGRLLIGVGSAVGFVGTLKLVAHWFPPDRFAFLTGMTMLVAMTGGVGGQAPLAQLVEVTGWRWAVVATASFGVALAVATWAIVRDRPPGETARPVAASARGILGDLRYVLTSPQNWIIALYGGMMSAPMLAYAALWGVPHLMLAYDLERPAAAGSASIMLIGWAVGAPVGGWLSDAIRRRKTPMLLAALASLVGWLVLLYLPGLPLAAAWVLLFLTGMVSGGMVVCLAAARELAPVAVSGAVTGFVNGANVGAGALMQPFVGYLLDLNWQGGMIDGARIYSLATYTNAFAALPAAAVIAAGAALFIRETYCRPVADT